MVIPENIYTQLTYRHSSYTSMFRNVYTFTYTYIIKITEEGSHEFEACRKKYMGRFGEKGREILYYNLKSKNTCMLIYAFF